MVLNRKRAYGAKFLASSYLKCPSYNILQKSGVLQGRPNASIFQKCNLNLFYSIFVGNSVYGVCKRRNYRKRSGQQFS